MPQESTSDNTAKSRDNAMSSSQFDMMTDDSSLSRFLNENMMSQSSTSSASVAMATSFSGADKLSAMSDEKLDSFLSSLWDKQTKDDRPPCGLKRKASDEGVVGSTDSVDGETGGAGGVGAANKPSQRNVLLAKLLSKRAATETVVNPRAISTVSVPHPYLAVPHAALKEGAGAQTAELPMMPMGAAQKPTAWDNPRTDPNSPFPGNTKDNPGLAMQSNPSMPSSVNQNLNALLADAMVGNTSGVAAMSNNNLMEALGGMTAMTDSMAMSAANSGGVSSTTGPRSLQRQQSALPHNTTTDPLLSDILQEATELQNDINMRHLGTSTTTGGATDSSVAEDMFDQIEQVMNSIPLPDLENFLGPYGTFDVNEQMAINAIQQQLMSVDSSSPATPRSGSTVQMQAIGVNTQLSPHSMLGAVSSPITSPQDPQQSLANMEQQLRQHLQGAAHSPHSMVSQQLQRAAHSPLGAMPQQGFAPRPNMLPSHSARFVQPHGE